MTGLVWPCPKDQNPWSCHVVDAEKIMFNHQRVPKSEEFSLKGEPVEFAANVLAKCLKGIWSSRNGKEPVVPEEHPSYTANKLAKSYFAGARVKAEQRRSD
ncbi:MAG: hypothetical protein Q9215_004186 [Flavoplaca cf. flavocitrina]